MADSKKRLHIGNLAWKIREDDLRDEFARFGDIADLTVVVDRETGRSKGFGFVEYTTEAAAEDAIETMNGTEVFGRPLRVSVAERKQGGRR